MRMNKTIGMSRQRVETRFGVVSYLEAGQGPPAVFVHGVFLNADLWRYELEGMADLRHCLAVDLLGHGESGWPEGAELTFELQAEMIVAFSMRSVSTRWSWWPTTAAGGSPSWSPPGLRAPAHADAHQLRHRRQLAAGRIRAHRRTGSRRCPGRCAPAGGRRPRSRPRHPGVGPRTARGALIGDDPRLPRTVRPFGGASRGDPGLRGRGWTTR